ncbi:MAG: sulfatase [Pirellulales bacterium]
MARANQIVLIVDRLHAGMLGAYGNSWIHTDHFDHLASRSFVFDQAYLQSPELAAIYRGYWQGLPLLSATEKRGHSTFPELPAEDPHSSTAKSRMSPLSTGSPSLPGLLSDAGWHTALLTDEPQLATFPPATQFNEQQLVPTPPIERPAEDIWATQLARVFMAAAQWLAKPRDPFLLWVHARGMAAPWDAPLTLRNQYADEEDPTPPEFVAPPDRLLAEHYDPDELLGITHAYAGQVSLFDACLGALTDQLEETGLAQSTHLALLSARGFPLGEHLRVGPCDGALYNELIQLPWLLHQADGAGALARSQALVQPSDLPGTLLDALEVDRAPLAGGRATSLVPIVRGERDAIREWISLTSQHDRAVRTPAWLLRQPAEGAAELYAKPADRWEVNEVARLCGDVVEGLEHLLAMTANLGESPVEPLADLLIREVD